MAHWKGMTSLWGPGFGRYRLNEELKDFEEKNKGWQRNLLKPKNTPIPKEIIFKPVNESVIHVLVILTGHQYNKRIKVKFRKLPSNLDFQEPDANGVYTYDIHSELAQSCVNKIVGDSLNANKTTYKIVKIEPILNTTLIERYQTASLSIVLASPSNTEIPKFADNDIKVKSHKNLIIRVLKRLKKLIWF